MDLANKFGSINIPKPHTKGHFSMEISKAMPNIRILTFSIRGDFRIIKFLGPEKLSIKMDKHSRVNSWMERSMATGYILGQIDLDLRVNIKTTKSMATANSLIPITKYLMATGWMARDKVKAQWYQITSNLFMIGKKTRRLLRKQDQAK